MIEYNVETLTEGLLEELKPVLEAHWGEIAMHKDKIALNPDYESYLKMQEIGAIQAVVVREGPIIVGYFISFIFSHPHYKDHKFAQNDILYVSPKHRGGTIAYRMFKYAEKELKKVGCDVLMLHMKIAFPFDRLCESLGMTQNERVYTKYIGE